ncbi:Bacitracin transport permease protein BcrB [Trichinella spiralis]|uniref:Bacitracin transport permease protein BcrB n=1 Tax=Trichinella spiralis TaxID=6334 RepID=A0ABR3KVX5_TRISP
MRYASYIIHILVYNVSEFIVSSLTYQLVETIEYNSFELRLTSFEAFLFGRLLLAINTSQYIFEGAKDPETRRMM